MKQRTEQTGDLLPLVFGSREKLDDDYFDFFSNDGLEEMVVSDGGEEISIPTFPYNAGTFDYEPLPVEGSKLEEVEEFGEPSEKHFTDLDEKEKDSVFVLQRRNANLRHKNFQLRQEGSLLRDQLAHARGMVTSASRRLSREGRKSGDVRMIDRLPPQALELEQAVLGAYVANPEWMAQFNQPYVNLMLYDLRHVEIHKSMIDLGGKLDEVSLSQHLKGREALEQVGGMAYINALQNAGQLISSPVTILNYIESLEDVYLKREVIKLATQCVGALYENKVDDSSGVSHPIKSMPEFIRHTTNSFLQCLPFRFRCHEDTRTIVDEVMQGFDALVQRGGRPKISTGYNLLDRITHGIRGDRLIVAGARPKIGKTTFNVNLAYNLAKQDKGTVIFTFETSRREYIERLIAREAGVNSELFYMFNSEDKESIEKINAGKEAVKDMPLWIDGRKPNIDYIVSRSRELKMLHPNISLVVIDGMQAFAGYVQYQGSKSDVYYEVLKKLKSDVARELDLTVLVNAQLKGEVERRKGKRPNSIDDFSDCKGLPEVADSAILLYRPEEYWPDNPAFRGWMEVIPVALRVGEKRDRTGKLGIDIRKSHIYNLPPAGEDYII